MSNLKLCFLENKSVDTSWSFCSFPGLASGYVQVQRPCGWPWAVPAWRVMKRISQMRTGDQRGEGCQGPAGDHTVCPPPPRSLTPAPAGPAGAPAVPPSGHSPPRPGWQQHCAEGRHERLLREAWGGPGHVTPPL